MDKPTKKYSLKRAGLNGLRQRRRLLGIAYTKTQLAQSLEAFNNWKPTPDAKTYISGRKLFRLANVKAGRFNNAVSYNPIAIGAL